MKFNAVNLSKKSTFAVGFGVVVFAISSYVSYSSPIANTREEISKVEAELSEAFADYGKEVVPGFIFLGPLWKDVEKIFQPLTQENRRIAKAKVMVRYYDRTPDPYDMEIWQDRAKLSKMDWRVEGKGTRLLRSMGISALIGSFSSILLLGLASAVSWAWYFLLDRIRELSKAIRG
ncbi:MAG: hypothetical protein L0338_39835 [Acidobacteria bacterium]|nr:hypothetical protein [Acidobacteriota bacterium]